MMPTMETSGELVLESKLISKSNIQRGELITFVSPIHPGRMVCKRVIGLPGDIVCVDPKGLYVPATEHVVIPKGHLWVAGDNMDASRDSRVYGPIPLALVRGKLIAKVRTVCMF